MKQHISRHLNIGDRQLIVVDSLFSEAEIVSLYKFLERLPYRLDDVDSIETAYSRHWKVELPVEMALGTPVLRQCAQAAHALLPASPLQLERAHANLHLYGDVQFPHVDLLGGATAIYYANPRWDEKWMGETIFYDDTREPLHAVAPKPGRLVLFHAEIVHRAGVPSRECYVPRITVALKFSSPPPA